MIVESIFLLLGVNNWIQLFLNSEDKAKGYLEEALYEERLFLEDLVVLGAVELWLEDKSEIGDDDLDRKLCEGSLEFVEMGSHTLRAFQIFTDEVMLQPDNLIDLQQQLLAAEGLLHF